VRPLIFRSAECFFTARANSPRENNCNSVCQSAGPVPNDFGISEGRLPA
jgi:hypothetical protein